MAFDVRGMSCFTACFSKKVASPSERNIETEISGIENIILYTYKELQTATEDFSPVNKIGRGGFGYVYKGMLKDGTFIAVKVLSAESSQGLQEFLTEMVLISHAQHENLVKLYGCCVEGGNRILVYGYLENGSLDQTLLGGGHDSLQFSWKTRTKICIGIAKGLSFLHEELNPNIIHRDIKASNILLDKDLNPKISDFGLAKLFPSNQTHISTRVAGTLGYLAPEYAVKGQLTKNADIYSFGVLLLEIVSGRCNTNRRLPIRERYILDKAWELYDKGELVLLVDASLEENFDAEEAYRYLQIALLCTHEIPKIRPSMSTVLKMLTGEMNVDDKKISKPGVVSDFLGLKSQKNDASSTLSAGSEKQYNSSSSENTSMTYGTFTFNSIYDQSA